MNEDEWGALLGLSTVWFAMSQKASVRSRVHPLDAKEYFRRTYPEEYELLYGRKHTPSSSTPETS